METSVFIAKLLSLMYVVVGLGMLFSGAYYKKALSEMLKQSGFMYLGGLMALFIGFLIVFFHNVWEGWPILITLVGWLALLKGVVLLVFPKAMMKWAGSMYKSLNPSAIGVIALILGFVFGYFGYLV
jgi:uncharacterized protein YjeT (DUF2065 family)